MPFHPPDEEVFHFEPKNNLPVFLLHRDENIEKSLKKIDIYICSDIQRIIA